MVAFRPDYEGEFPTLGWYVLEWFEEMLAAPDRPEYVPLVLTPEQARFVLNYYRVDTATGMRRTVRRAVLSRSKGWGKSPLLGGIGCAEALADVVPDGFDASGRPVGKPWADVRTPWVQFAAVSEDQTKNAWAPVLEMLREGPVVDEYPGLEPLDTFVNLPGKGRIEPVTASSTSREGNRPVWVGLDQTEEWLPSNGGVRLASTLRRNLGKTNGSSIESPNAYIPGRNSVAEKSAATWSLQIERNEDGTQKHPRLQGLLVDHREAPPDTDISDRKSLINGLTVAYGDSAAEVGGWVDLERLVAEIWDPDTDPMDARRYYLNQVTAATDSFVTQPEWAGARIDIVKPTIQKRVVSSTEPIVLGFDGSRARTRGTTDATALVAVAVADGYAWPVGVWEQPDGPEAEGWEVPEQLVEATVDDTFSKFNVVGFFADPTLWESNVARWEAKYGRRLKVGVPAHPVTWRTSQVNRTVQAVADLHSAILNCELTHGGSPVLTRHVLNARRRHRPQGDLLFKEFPESANKIDAAYALMLAWQARLAALSKGVQEQRASRVPVRVR
jgi:hypothetical protein